MAGREICGVGGAANNIGGEFWSPKEKRGRECLGGAGSWRHVGSFSDDILLALAWQMSRENNFIDAKIP